MTSPARLVLGSNSQDVFFTSDLEFGNRLTARNRRPFVDVNHMNGCLIDQWNHTVGPNGVVIVLGNFTVMSMVSMQRLLCSLRGRKILIPGWRESSRASTPRFQDRWSEAFERAGFDQVINRLALVEVGGEPVLLHPLAYEVELPANWYRRIRIPATAEAFQRPVDLWSPIPDRGSWLVHGGRAGWLQRGRQINVAVDCWGGRPVSLAVIEHIIDHGPARVEAPSWS